MMYPLTWLTLVYDELIEVDFIYLFLSLLVLFYYLQSFVYNLSKFYFIQFGQFDLGHCQQEGIFIFLNRSNKMTSVYNKNSRFLYGSPQNSLKKPPFNVRSTRKEQYSSSEEQANIQQFQLRRQLSLKLFQGIKQLQEPQPEYRQQQEIQLEEQLLFRKQKQPRTNLIQRKDFMKTGEVKYIVRELCSQYESFVFNRIRIQQEYICMLQKKIYKLQNRMRNMPIQFMKFQDVQKRMLFEENQKQIKQLHLKMSQLYKQQQQPKQPKKSSLKQQKHSLPIKIHSPHYFDHKSFQPNKITQNYIYIQSQQHSLLQGIDQVLQDLNLKQNRKNNSSIIIPATNSNKLICEVQQPVEDTIKKKHKSLVSNLLLMSSNQSTFKKPVKKISGGKKHIDFGPIGKNKIMAVQEQLYPLLSNSVSSAQAQESHMDTKTLPEKINKQIYLMKNPRKILKFAQQPDLDPLQYSSLQQSQAQQFHLQKSYRHSIKFPNTTNNVPSLKNQFKIQESFNLSQQEKYMFDEIMLLKQMIQITQKEENIKQSVQQLITRRKSMEQKRKTQQNYNKMMQRQQQLVKLLKKTRIQLSKIKKNIFELIPCQYCDFRQLVLRKIQR